MKILVIIPTYNEIDNIERLLGRLLNVSDEIEMLVVDDNSPDGTGQLVEQLTLSYPRIHLLKRARKEGIGPAYLAGFEWGLEKNYSAFIEMDADLSHRPRYLPRMLKEIKNYDMVIGSRWIKGGGISNWPAYRMLLSRMASVYSKFILGVPVADMTAGFVCYRRNVLEGINLRSIHSDGYGFQIEMKFRAHRKGFKLTEFPIQFTNRKAGSSKISKMIVWEALWLVWRLRFER